MAGWGGVGSMREGGGLVGRRVVGRLGVGRSFPEQILIQVWAKKKSGIKTVPKKKKTGLGNRNWAEEKRSKRKIILTR